MTLEPNPSPVTSDALVSPIPRWGLWSGVRRALGTAREAVAGSGVVTGERVTTLEGGFNPTWQRHVAAYRGAAALFDDARVPAERPLLDVGCGIGHSFTELAPRETIGVDVDARALRDQERATFAADMRALPFEAGSFDGLIAVHSIEHVPDAHRALAEFARVLRPGGVAILVTPNRLTFARPDEVIDPYHYVEYDRHQFAAACRPHFPGGNVEVIGLFGSERYQALVDVEKAKLDRLLALDPLKLRRLVPRRVKMALYDRRLTAQRRRDPDPRAASITPDDFRLGPEDVDRALDVVAICRKA
jgi:SAM-dependent methyltransferase